jgi:hypothetical protein
MMRRYVGSAMAAAVVLMGVGSGLQAQDVAGDRAGRVDLGIYAGYMHNTPWATTALGDLGPSVHNPAFGGMITFWMSPSFGFRTHAAYLPHAWGYRGDPPANTPITIMPEFAERGRSVDTWFYDLSLVARPFAAQGGFVGKTYLFAGGGAVTSFARGSEGCREPGISQSVCLSRDWSIATVGQGTAGLGLELLPLGRHFGIYAEAGIHGHSGPEHTGIGFTGVPEPETTTDEFVLSTRAVLGLRITPGRRAVVEPVAPPPAPTPAPPPPVAPTPPAERTIQVCVIQDGQLRMVEATFVPATNDTVIVRDGQRVRFAQAYPTGPTFAAGADWFVAGEAIRFQNRTYNRFGLPRVMTPPQDQLTRVGEHRGVPLFAAPGAATPAQVLYVPIRPTCEFQPYQLEEVTRRVRG